MNILEDHTKNSIKWSDFWLDGGVTHQGNTWRADWWERFWAQCVELEVHISFLRAAITNYYKFSGLKQHRFIILTVLEVKASEISLVGLKSKGWQDWFLLDPSGQNLFLASSCFERLFASFGLWPHHFSLCFCGLTSPSSPARSHLLPLSCEGPCDYTRPSWVSLDNLHIIRCLTWSCQQSPCGHTT